MQQDKCCGSVIMFTFIIKKKPNSNGVQTGKKRSTPLYDSYWRLVAEAVFWRNVDLFTIFDSTLGLLSEC